MAKNDFFESYENEATYKQKSVLTSRQMKYAINIGAVTNAHSDVTSEPILTPIEISELQFSDRYKQLHSLDEIS